MIPTRSRSPIERAASAWPPAARYTAALLLVLMTTGLIALVNSGWGLLTHVTIENPGTIYIVSVTLAAIFLGFGPALVAVVASTLAVYLAFSLHESFSRMIVLIATMLIIIALAERQRRAQDAAERVRAQLAAIVEGMSDAVMVVDAAGRATNVNRAAIAMLGAADDAEALAKVMYRRPDGTPATDEYALLERALGGEDAPQTDVSIADGTDDPRTVSAVANPMRDARGQIIGAVSVSRDITERFAQVRERERLLRQVEQERQYSQYVLENAPVGIAVVRADDFTLLSFNEEYDASVRRAPGATELTVGKSLLDAMPVASHEAATRLLSTARDEHRMIRNAAYASAVVPDQFYDGTIQPLRLGDGTPALLITSVNVTERVRGEQEREGLIRAIEQEQRYTRMILDTAPVAIGVVRPDDLMVLNANAVFEGALSDLSGRPFAAGMSFSAAMPDFEESEFVRQLRRAVAEERTLSVSGYAARIPAGRYYDWTMTPLALQDGARATLVTFADVTARVEGEREREALLQQVERQAAQLAATFEAMVDGVAVYDAAGTVLHRNEAFYRLLHLETGAAPPVWEAFIRDMHLRRADGTPLTREGTHSFRALHGETIRDEVILVRDGRGRDRAMRQNASPIRAADGGVIGAVVVFNDVTERLEQEREREALLALVEERRRFTQAIFDTVPVALSVVDTDALVFEAANPAYLDGVPDPYRSLGVNGRALTTVLPHTRENGFADQLQRVGLTGEPFHTAATRYEHPTRGTTYWNETMIPLVTNDAAAHHVLYIAAEVTEQTQAQQRIAALAQAASERAGQLEAVFGALTEGLILTDAAGTIIRSNAALTRILGLDDEAIPPLDTFGERFAMRDMAGVAIPQANRVALAALDGATATEQLRRFRDARGAERWMSVSASPVRDETGAITGVAMMMRDVTDERHGVEERERLLREVEQRERFTQAIFDSVPVGLMVVGVADGVIRTANDAYAHFIDERFAGGDLAGRKAALLQPTGATTPLPENAEEQYLAGLRNLAAGRASITVREFAYPDFPGRGETFWDLIGVPLFEADGAVNDVLVLTVDTTEQTLNRRKVEELAATAEQRAAELEAIFANMPDGVAIYGADATLIQMNAAGQLSASVAEDVSPSESLTEAVARYAFTYPDGRPIPPDDLPLARALRGETVSGYEFVSQTRQGAVYRLASSAPITNAAGEITRAVVMFTDITARKQAEQERERLLREVEEGRTFARTVIDSAPAGIVVFGSDPAFTVRLANDQFSPLLREPWRSNGVIGVPLAEFLPRAEESGILPIFRRVVETGEPVSLAEFEYEGENGRTIYYDWSLVPLREGGDRVTGLILLISDATDRVLSRQQIEELADVAAQRAAELEAMVANMPIGVAIHRPDGHLVQMNRVGRQIAGEAVASETSARGVVEHFQLRYPDGRAIPLDDLPLARALRGEVVSDYQYVGRTRRGDRSFVGSSAPIRNAAGEITSAIVMFTDITERRRAEELATRLGRILDVSSNEIYVYDAATLRFMQVNESALRNLGYTLDELTAMTSVDIKPAFTAESFEAVLAPLRAGERDEVRFDTVHRRKDGSLYPIDALIQISRTETPPVFVSIVQDITERHAAEQQREQLLKEIDERRRFVQTVIESAPVGIAVFATDAEVTVRIANDQYLQALDESWRSAGIVGRGVHEFVPAEVTETLLSLYRRVVESGEPIFVHEFEQTIRRDATAYVDWSLVPLMESGDRVTGVLSLVSDVTDRVRSRQRIEELAWDAAKRASELETVIASIADGVMVTDAEGRIILENDAARSLTGRARSAAAPGLAAQGEARYLRDADGTPLPPHELPLGRAVRGETVTDQVLLVQRADTGENRFLIYSSAPVQAVGGAITGAVAVFRDITEMKQLDQMKDEFISIAAHELRTPLTAIKGYAELLDRRLSAQGGREGDRKSLGVIRKQTERLSGLVNEMLDVSRIEAGRLQLNSEPFDLSALVGEVVSNMRVSATTHDLSLTAAPAIEVSGDTARIEQVLINLISNAITYSPEGGEISVRAWTEGAYALVSVTDHGVGMSQEELPHLFDRFYRAPKANIMRSGGMGLGLYICQEIVTRHGGTIAAESTEGAGSTFTFTLPLSGEG